MTAVLKLIRNQNFIRLIVFTFESRTKLYHRNTSSFSLFTDNFFSISFHSNELIIEFKSKSNCFLSSSFLSLYFLKFRL